MRFFFYRGPFDGLVWQRPITESIDKQLGVALDHIDGAVALYTLRAITLAPEWKADFIYVETVTAS